LGSKIGSVYEVTDKIKQAGKCHHLVRDTLEIGSA
jgi:hypothetical protein